MEKEFVPYVLALKLKELGLNEKCIMSFNYIPRNGNVRLVYGTVTEEYYTPAPLWQQTFNWFMKKHDIDSAILPTSSTKYLYRLYEQQSKSKTQIYGEYMGKEYKTYEEAREACLLKLIELVENGKNK